MEFVVKKIDLDLDLTLLDGTVHKFEPRVPTDLRSLLAMVKRWDKVNEVNDAKGTKDEKEVNEKVTPFELFADRFVELYGQTADWWLDNCNAETMTSIAKYVNRTIGGVKKSVAS